VSAYGKLESVLARGGTVLLDGGVGSELEQVGFPPDLNVGDHWGTVALARAPHLVREVHRRYASAGADVITTATWRIDTEPDWRATARLAVRLARDAAPGRAVAFSVWPEPAEPGFLAELAAVASAAGADLILAETIETIAEDLRFTKLEALLSAGLPVWAAFRWTVDGPPDLRPQGIDPWADELQDADGELFARAAPALERAGIAALLVNCVPRALVPGVLPLLRRQTAMPLGVYPNVGTFRNPGWRFDPTATPAEYAADALRWRDEEGAAIVGGCCGTTAAHIAAVARAVRGPR
jgi:homocysteine S-methyltransferase